MNSKDIQTLNNSGLEHYNQGEKNHEKDEVKKSIEYFDKILKLEPNNVVALKNKGNALIYLDWNDEAIKCFDKDFGN